MFYSKFENEILDICAARDICEICAANYSDIYYVITTGIHSLVQFLNVSYCCSVLAILFCREYFYISVDYIMSLNRLCRMNYDDRRHMAWFLMIAFKEILLMEILGICSNWKIKFQGEMLILHFEYLLWHYLNCQFFCLALSQFCNYTNWF